MKWSPVSKHQIQPGCGERAGSRGTGRPNLTRETKLSGANGDRENSKAMFRRVIVHFLEYEVFTDLPVLLSDKGMEVLQNSELSGKCMKVLQNS